MGDCDCCAGDDERTGEGDRRNNGDVAAKRVQKIKCKNHYEMSFKFI